MRIHSIAPALGLALASGLIFGGLLLAGLPGPVAVLVWLVTQSASLRRLGLDTGAVASMAGAALMLLAGCAFVLLGAGNSFAADAAAPADSLVTVPWGDWLAGLLGDAAAILAVVIMGIVTRFLPATLRQYLTAQRTAQVEQLLERALGFAAQKIAVEARGRSATIDLHNGLVADALQYAIDHGPSKLIEWMGGEAAIEQKIIARLSSSPSVKSLAVAPAAATP